MRGVYRASRSVLGFFHRHLLLVWFCGVLLARVWGGFRQNFASRLGLFGAVHGDDLLFARVWGLLTSPSAFSWHAPLDGFFLLFGSKVVRGFSCKLLRNKSSVGAVSGFFGGFTL